MPTYRLTITVTDTEAAEMATYLGVPLAEHCQALLDNRLLELRQQLPARKAQDVAQAYLRGDDTRRQALEDGAKVGRER